MRLSSCYFDLWAHYIWGGGRTVTFEYVNPSYMADWNKTDVPLIQELIRAV